MHRLHLTILLLSFTLGCSTDSKPSATGSSDLPGGLTRAEDPVVLTGAHVSSLGGADARDIVAFARQNDAWKQIPVQVDERLVQDFCEIYGKSSGRWGAEPACKTSKVVTALFYADAETFTGADPDPSLDLDDEVVFMARDGGDRVGTWSDPAGVVPGSGVELTLQDGEAQAWVYLFEREEDGLEADAGVDYVRYTFSLEGVDYKSEYDLYGTGCGGDAAVEGGAVTVAPPERGAQPPVAGASAKAKGKKKK